MAAQAEPGAAEAPKGKKKLPLPILIGIIAGIVLIGFGAKMVLGRGKRAEKSGKPKVEVGTIVALDDFLVNLVGNGSDHYLKTTIALGLKKGISSDQFKDQIPIARDAIISVLTAQHLSALGTDQGKEKLKTELKDAINQALGKTTVVAVYFTAFATQ